MKLAIIRALIPYLTVGLFWCYLDSAWLALVSYHVTILVFRDRTIKLNFKINRLGVQLALITVPSGILTYFLLDYFTKTKIDDWLISYGLEGTSFLLMIPYFGLIHPLIEQIHWSPLRKKTWISHLLFAGYHLLVLSSLLSTVWLIAAFFLLATVSLTWSILEEKTEGMTSGVLSHTFADFGIILATWFLIS